MKPNDIFTPTNQPTNPIVELLDSLNKKPKSQLTDEICNEATTFLLQYQENNKIDLEVKDQVAKTYYKIGEIWLELNNEKKAHDVFNEAIALNSVLLLSSIADLAQYYITQAKTYFSLNELEKSYDFTSQAIHYDKHNSEYNNILGMILLKQGKLDEASKAISKAIELEPTQTYISNHQKILPSIQKDHSLEDIIFNLDTDHNTQSDFDLLGTVLQISLELDS